VQSLFFCLFKKAIKEALLAGCDNIPITYQFRSTHLSGTASLNSMVSFWGWSLRLRSFGVIRIRISDPRSVWIMNIKGTGESTLVMDSPVPLMHHDPDRSWITDPDPDHPKGTQPKF